MYKCIYTIKTPLVEYRGSIGLKTDGIILVISTHRIVEVWDLTTGKINHSFKLFGDRYGHFHTTVHPNWETIISYNNYGSLIIYDLWTGKETSSFSVNNCNALAYSNDGNLLFFSSLSKVKDDYKSEIKILKASTGKLVKNLNFMNSHATVTALKVTPDDKILVASCYNKFTQFYDLQSEVVISTLNTTTKNLKKRKCKFINEIIIRPHWIDGLATLSNRKNIALLAISEKNETRGYRKILLWDIEKAEVINEISICTRIDYNGMIHDYHTPHSSVNLYGSILAIINKHNIEVWNLETLRKICVLNAHQSDIDNLVISPDGNTIVSYAYNESIKVWSKIIL